MVSFTFGLIVSTKDITLVLIGAKKMTATSVVLRG